jgi:TetR/AcrR family hemagglutinin/protease transcriptional regulator
MPKSVDGMLRLKPDHRRALLSVEGVRIFARRGIGRASHAEIAELGGVSVATVFKYFPTREDLVEDILRFIGGYHIDLFNNVLEASDHSETLPIIYDYVQALQNTAEDEPEYVKVWLEWAMSTRKETWSIYCELNDVLLSSLARQIEKAVKRGELTKSIPVKDRARVLMSSVRDLLSQNYLPEGKPRGFNSIAHRTVKYSLGLI